MADITDSTLPYMADEIKDSLFVEKSFLDAAGAKGKFVKVKQNTGSSFQQPLLVSRHSSVQPVLNDNTPISLATNEVLELASWSWAHATAPIVMGEVSKRENQGPEMRVAIKEARLKTVMEDMAAQLNEQILSNSGRDSDGFKQLHSLNGTAAGFGTSTGFLEAAAYGAQTTNTIGGVAKASYLDSLQNQWGDCSGDFSANGPNALDLLIGDCQKFGGRVPHVAIFSRAGWGNLRATLRANEFYTEVSDTKKFGYGKLVYNGVPIDYDPNLINTGATGDNIITAYVLNLEDIVLRHLPGCWFDVGEDVSGLMSQFNGSGSQLWTSVVLTASRLSGSGLLSDGDTI